MRALGPRDQLGALPLLVDDGDRGRFTQSLPNLVKVDHGSGEGDALVLISIKRDVMAILPDLASALSPASAMGCMLGSRMSA